jgi:hypothetical protein
MNLHNCCTTEAVKVTWYMVIQDILPTNERLYKIRLADSPLCRQCGALDTVLYRVTECGKGARIWAWTKRRIAWILHTDPANIPMDWTTRPQFQLWPPTRNRAVLRILAQMVWYSINEDRTCSVQDYCDFLRRTRWKTYRAKRRHQCVGNYMASLQERMSPWSRRTSG